MSLLTAEMESRNDMAFAGFSGLYTKVDIAQHVRRTSALAESFSSRQCGLLWVILREAFTRERLERDDEVVLGPMTCIRDVFGFQMCTYFRPTCGDLGLVAIVMVRELKPKEGDLRPRGHAAG